MVNGFLFPRWNIISNNMVHPLQLLGKWDEEDSIEQHVKKMQKEKVKKKQYDPTHLAEAVRMVKEDGLKLRQACRVARVPYTTLRNRIERGDHCD